jgi:hypothetical protein
VFYVQTANLEHLVNLKALKLPSDVHVRRSESSSAPLLPSLVSLQWTQALTKCGGALLPLPSLQRLIAGYADAPRLAALAGMPALRTLSCHPVLDGDGMQSATALAQLTQLTHLIAPVRPGDGLVPAAVSNWAAALSYLQGLHTLTLQAGFLELFDVSGLPVLKRFVVDVRRQMSTWFHTNSDPVQLLLRLAPARGRLQQVVLQGAPADMRQLYHRAVYNALGPVQVAFTA